MRKEYGFIVAFAFIFILSVSLVSAYFPGPRETVEEVIEAYVGIFEPLLEVILGGPDYNGLLLFEKLLIFVLLVAFVFVALSRIPMFDEKKGVLWIVAIIVPLIGVRFINFDWLNTILFSYQLLAIVLTSILPFIIYFFFIHEMGYDSSAIRKVAWVLFIVVYLGLWITAETESFAVVFFWTIVVSLLFLLMDGTIHRYYMKEQMKAAGSSNKWEHINKLRRDIHQIRDDLSKGIISSSREVKRAKKMIKKKEKLINDFQKQS
jgi:hypothetical protein